MNKRLIAALAAVVLLGLGAGLLIGYVNKADDRAFDNAKRVSVLQVTNDIPAGTKAEDISGSVKEVKLPKSAVAPGSIDDLADVAGLQTTVALKPGEQLLKDRFSEKGSVVGATGEGIPEGAQELTVALPESRAAGGQIKAGDIVGVVSSFSTADGDAITRLIKNKVLVTRVRVASDETAPDKDGKPLLVTLAVFTKEAGAIINTLEFGKLYLTKQNADTEPGNGGFASKIEIGSR